MKRFSIFPAVALALLLLTVSARANEPEKEQPVAKTGISTGRYITGGIIGSAVGFGIGHAIHRRYMPLGLVFTLGEAAAFTAFFADTSFGTSTVSGITTVRATRIGTLGVIGLVVATGLHIWEVVDVWVTGASLREEKHADNTPRLMIVPSVMHNEAPALTMALRF